MTSRMLCVLLAVTVLPLIGCKQPDADNGKPAAISQEKAADGLVVTLEVPSREFVQGETVPVTVRVTNTSDQPIQIRATSAALVKFTVWQKQVGGLARIKTIPEMAAQVLSPWVLEADSTRTFTRDLEVTKDWPTNEILWLSAELNGREGLMPKVYFEVKTE